MLTVLGVALAAVLSHGDVATADQITGSGGAYGRTGDISVLDAQFAFAGRRRRGVPPGRRRPAPTHHCRCGSTDDRLTEVSSPVAALARITGDPCTPGGQWLTAGYVEPVASVETRNASSVDTTLVGLTEPVRAGLTYPVTFTFQHAGSLTADLPRAHLDPVRLDDDRHVLTVHRDHPCAPSAPVGADAPSALEAAPAPFPERSWNVPGASPAAIRRWAMSREFGPAADRARTDRSRPPAATAPAW